MSTPPFMPLYISDYLGDTGNLTTEEHGAYLLLLMAAWNNGGWLPYDATQLSRFARCTTLRWARIAPRILGFFEFDPRSNCLVNPRLADEYEKASSKSQKRAISGALGGKATARKNKGNDPAKAAVLLQHSPEPDPEPEIRTPVVEEDILSAAHAHEEIDLSWMEDLKPRDSALSVLDRLDRGLNAEPVGGVSVQDPPARSLSEMAASVFDAMAPAARARLKNGAKDIHRLLREANKNGEDAEQIAQETAAYYRHSDQHDRDGKFSKGVYSVIRDGYWRNWRGDAFVEATPSRQRFAPAGVSAGASAGDPKAGPVTVLFAGVGYAAPPGASTDPECTDNANPGVHLQLVWLEDWYGYPSADRFRHWARGERGPMPGEPGCRVWPSVIEKYETLRLAAK